MVSKVYCVQSSRMFLPKKQEEKTSSSISNWHVWMIVLVWEERTFSFLALLLFSGALQIIEVWNLHAISGGVRIWRVWNVQQKSYGQKSCGSWRNMRMSKNKNVHRLVSRKWWLSDFFSTLDKWGAKLVRFFFATIYHWVTWELRYTEIVTV